MGSMNQCGKTYLKASQVNQLPDRNKQHAPSSTLSLYCCNRLYLGYYCGPDSPWLHPLSSTKVPSRSSWRSLHRECSPYAYTLSLAVFHGAEEIIRSVLPLTPLIVGNSTVRFRKLNNFGRWYCVHPRYGAKDPPPQ